jgi:hypothetical protein
VGEICALEGFEVLAGGGSQASRGGVLGGLEAGRLGDILERASWVYELERSAPFLVREFTSQHGGKGFIKKEAPARSFDCKRDLAWAKQTHWGKSDAVLDLGRGNACD